MPVAHIDLFFELPEDFDGGFDEMLKAVIDYRKSNGRKEPKKSDYSEEIDQNNSVSKTGYDRLMMRRLEIHKETKLIGTISVLEKDS